MLDFPRWKVIWIWGVLAALCALSIPSFLPERITNSWGAFPHPRVNLGLDLAGGSYLLLEADTADVKKQRIDQMRETVTTEMRRNQPRISIGDISTQDGRLSFMVRDPSQVDAARERINNLTNGAGMSGQRDWDIQIVDTSRFVLIPTDAGIKQAIDRAMDDATDVVRRRIDELGTKEPTIIRQGQSRIIVQVPGLQNPKQLKDLLGRTARLEFKLVDQNADPVQLAKGVAPVGSQVLRYVEGGAPIAVKRSAIISGDQLIDARQEFDQQNNSPVVSITFNGAGGRKFALVTQQNTGKPFAIIVDNQVISAPNINEPILGGKRADFGRVHDRKRQPARDRAALGQVAGGAEGHRGIDRQPRTRRRFDPRRRARLDHRGGRGRGVHAAHLRALRALCEPRGGHQRAGHPGGDGDAQLDADPAGYRGLRADDRHRGRRQRADQRTHPRGAAARAQRRDRGRTGLQGSVAARSSRRTSPTPSRASSC